MRKSGDVELVGVEQAPGGVHGEDLDGGGFGDLDEVEVAKVVPVRANSFSTAGTGPMPIAAGSQPATAQPSRQPRDPRGHRKTACRGYMASSAGGAGIRPEPSGTGTAASSASENPGDTKRK